MQKIKHDYKNKSHLFTMIEYLYEWVSDTKLHSIVYPCFSYKFKPLVDIFKQYKPVDKINVITTHGTGFDKLKLPEYDSKNIIVCFSGGKDSIATALHYKNLDYNVYLYYMKGINKCYPNEFKTVIKVAEYMGLPLCVDEVHLGGTHDYVEHPMKNMIIANGALNYGIENNIGIKVAFGTYYTSFLMDNPFDICAGDCRDMWEAYEYLIQAIIPKFHIYTPLKNINTTLKALEPDKKLLELSQSCIGTHRFREYRHNYNMNKFHIDLMPGRCGSCWKCAVEYIYYTDHNILNLNIDYYKHCLDVLVNTLKQEGNPAYSIQSLWNEFFFYPMSKSKLRKELKDVTIQARTIKFTK